MFGRTDVEDELVIMKSWGRDFTENHMRERLTFALANLPAGKTAKGIRMSPQVFLKVGSPDNFDGIKIVASDTLYGGPIGQIVLEPA